MDRARQQAHSPAARRDRKRRQHLAEVSFADAANQHGFKRARWRRLWRVQIEDWLIAAIQNIKILLKQWPAAVRDRPLSTTPPSRCITTPKITHLGNRPSRVDPGDDVRDAVSGASHSDHSTARNDSSGMPQPIAASSQWRCESRMWSLLCRLDSAKMYLSPFQQNTSQHPL